MPAQRLTDAVFEALRLHTDRERPLGPVGLRTAQAETACILGGILRAGLKGRPVAAQRRPGAPLWQASVIGCRAFWAKADAMVSAGLLGMKAGIRVPETVFDATTFGGKPTALWPTERLLARAAEHGVGLDTLASEWPISETAETRRTELPRAKLVVLRALDGKSEAQVPPDQQDHAEGLRDRVARLNAAVAFADVRGCLAPTFRRIFHADLRLHGRHYAIGTSNVQTMAEAERAAVTIGGEPVVELDIRASLLSVFLGLTTGELPVGDPYEAASLPRTAVKAWTTMTFGAGKPAARWSDRSPADARKVRCGDVRDAMLRACPTLANIADVLPADIRGDLPAEAIGRAAGLFLIGVEAEIIANAMDAVLAAGGVPLPIHDGLIVAARFGEVASAAMSRAFAERTGVEPAVR